MISVFFISKFGHGPEVWEAGEGREGVSVMMDAMKFYMRVMIFTLQKGPPLLPLGRVSGMTLM